MNTYKQISPNNGKHHWFGYYDVCPWSADQTKMLCLESDFMDHSPQPDDEAKILLIDLADNNKSTVIASTTAWNWQMSARLQWLGDAPDEKILYNDRRDGKFVGIIKNIKTGTEKVIPKAIYAMNHDGLKGVTLNFSRLHDCRPGYGYSGLVDSDSSVNAPDNDGIYLVDIDSAKSKLILSYAQIGKFLNDDGNIGQKQWINHLFFSPDDKRILFFYRYRTPNGNCISHLVSADIDGGNLTNLGKGDPVSHYDWQDDKGILIWAKFIPEKLDDYYYWVKDHSGEKTALKAGLFKSDGHCSISPCGKWMMTDTYPNKDSIYNILLFNFETEKYIKAFDIPHSKLLKGDTRCDLHPRWSRDGKQICFDASCNDMRQVYIANVHEITSGK